MMETEDQGQISKPDGFDLRDKRSEKSGNAAQWQPRDALFDASQAMHGKETTCLFVAWRERLPDGDTRTVFRFSGDAGQGEALILRALGRFMRWEKDA